ncbi:MAG TPA: serine/threonine-protein kinase [Polyangiaceae bacterium]|nr:serine/threonine-protein kinase [Polyangiaceae bacterium]
MRSTTKKTLNAAVIAQRYRLEREMARGGMGTVWLARDSKLGRLVAIKVMAKELAQMSEALARFEREALAVAQLRSSHVVQVFDYGLHEGLPYIVMELLEGENLGQRLKRMGRIPLDQVIEIVTQMCKGLKAAHGAGLIHRDLKPSNIFLARRDDAELVKLLDFGVVKATDPLAQMGGTETTSTGILLGTPQYMSPEQARATKEIDFRSDLWSTAVILFRILTGHNPFKGDSVGDVVLKICSDALPKIREHAPELPDSLDDFFEKAFARHPDDRFQSAVELSRAFRYFAADDTQEMVPSVRPPPIPSVPDPPSAPVSISNKPLEATPVSTTVGGTPIASKLPPPARAPQPVPVVIAGAAITLVVGAMGAVWLVGDAPDETGATRNGALVLEAWTIPEVEVPEEEEEHPPKPAVEVEVKTDKTPLKPPTVKPPAPASSEKGSSKTSRPDWGL